MFTCDRCGSSYNPAHAVALEYCPRCLARDRTTSTLAFKAFRLPSEEPARGPAADAPSGALPSGMAAPAPADSLRPAAEG